MELPSKYCPLSAGDFVGPAQHVARRMLRFIEHSKVTGDSLAFLMTGPAGTGKSTLAHFCGLQLGVPASLIEPMNGTELTIERVNELAQRLHYRPLFGEWHAAEEAASGAKEVARGALVAAARPFHFTINHGHQEIPSSVSVQSPKGEVRVSFKDSYKKVDDAKFEAIKGIIGESLAETYLEQTFVFKVDIDKIPSAKLQSVIDAIQELALRLNIVDAVSVAACYKPNPAWHSARFRVLTPEQNIRLETIVDREKGYCTAAVAPGYDCSGYTRNGYEMAHPFRFRHSWREAVGSRHLGPPVAGGIFLLSVEIAAGHMLL